MHTQKIFLYCFSPEFPFHLCWPFAMLACLAAHQDGPFVCPEEMVLEGQPTLLQQSSFVLHCYLPGKSTNYFHEKAKVSSPEDQGCNSAICLHRIMDCLRFAVIAKRLSSLIYAAEAGSARAGCAGLCPVFTPVSQDLKLYHLIHSGGFHHSSHL